MPQTLDRFRSSTLGWLRGTLAGWGTILLVPIGLIGWLMTATWYPLLAVAAALVIVAVKWLGNLATTYEVTEDRLILHKGILNKSIDEIELYRIKDIRIDFSLINQWAGIGTITLLSSDETTGAQPFVIRDIENARERREKLRDLVNAARRVRGVREFDMVQEATMPQ
ncbi:MAG: PH domain-containing protein [Sphingomonas sp.]|uniref:PH domain-containing protein n=1 Tax=Sphingomonas sp. TaxID=28214 RepID=UPI0012150245|nr:PH domain-containing protein [Sphingomonas sp.]THD37369.1 MAG: PH domain-containing protein [Sphingomonas sp.]